MKRILALLIVLALLIPTLPIHAEQISTTDMMGRRVTLDKPATRVVALTASDVEILYALGAGDTLVGRGEYCDYPPEALTVPAVASGFETSYEQIIALAPDVVLMNAMNQTKEQSSMLESAGITVVVSNAANIAETYVSIEIIGAVVGRTTEAAALIESMKTAFDSLAASASPSDKTVYFEVSPLEWGLWTAGTGTFMDELSTLAGLTNVFADVSGWAAISEEQVLMRNPDYIVTITMYYGEGPTPDEEIKSRAGWAELTAVKNDRVLILDSNEISRPGPRLTDAARSLVEYVNGK